MMLAQAGNVNIPNKHHLIMILGKDSIVDDIYEAHELSRVYFEKQRYIPAKRSS